jgi:hypothetical protein
MLERGEISFVVLWILNPIVILFYQNCSYTPPERAEAATMMPAAIAQPAPKTEQAERTPSCTQDTQGGRCVE